MCDVPDGLFTPLHAAAVAGDEHRIVELLEAGADPTAQDAKGRVPFDVCGSRGARRIFRFWREQNESRWDWSLARVPGDAGRKQEQPPQGKNHGRTKKSKRRQQSTCDAAPSPRASPSCVTEKRISQARHQERSANKWQVLAVNIAAARKQPRPASKAQAAAHKMDSLPRPIQRSSAARRLAN